MNKELAASEQIFRDLDQIPVLYIIVLIAIAFVLTSLAKRGIPALARLLPPRFSYYLLPMIPICRLIITAGTLILLVPTVIEPTMQNLIAFFGAVGLALGFAFKDFASSLIAGIIAVYEQPYRVGDRVTIDGIYGEVQAINLRSLKLITPDDNAVTIPHNCIWNNSIQNANDGFREQQCVTMFYLQPDHDAEEVRQILRDVALTSPYTQFSRPLRVSLQEKPWATCYKIRSYPIDGHDEFAYISDLTSRGKSALREAGFKFASTALVADSETS